MKPLVVFDDPEAAVRTILLEAFAGRSEPYVPALPNGVSTSYPSVSLADDATHVQVELENGNTNDFPVVERNQVRVSCHAAKRKRSNVKDLASLAHGLLCAYDGPLVSGIFPRGGRSGVIADDATTNLMCWFLVRVDLLASSLSS